MIRGEDIKVLEDMFDSRKTFYIPVYQRNYDWKKEHCEKLLLDIENAVNRDVKEYFIGSFVLVKKLDDKENFHIDKNFYIIDGQQRITTIVLLLLAILDYAKNNNKTLQPTIEQLIFSDIKKHRGRLFLKQIQKDDEYLNKILDNAEIKEGQSNIVNNYLYFKKRLDNNSEYITKLLKGLYLLKGIRITLEQEDEPQIIFETLNATGLSLKEADKIRNYVLMYKNQNELYKNYWVKIEENCLQRIDEESVSTFIRYFLAIKSEEFSKEAEVYNDFKKYLKDKNNEEVLRELLEYSQLYNIILDENNKNVVEKIRNKLSNIKELKANIINPFIILLLKLRKDNKLTDDYLYDILHFIENYIIRRLICSKPSNSLNKICISLIKKTYLFFNNNKNNTFVEHIANVLTEFKGSGEFPDDSAVKNSILEKDVYKSILGKFILTRLELFDSKEKIDIDDDITIEHIMPRTLSNAWKKLIGNNYKELHDRYINTIGNLTLTGYNPELSNKILKDKVDLYRKSKFKFLNKDLVDLKEWNEEIITKRTNRLINELLEHYKYPQNTNKNASVIEEYFLDDSIDFSGMNICHFEYKNNKYDVRSFAVFFDKILSLIYKEDSVKFTNKIFNDNFFNNKISDKEFYNNYGKALKTEAGFFINKNNNTNTKIKLLLKVLEKLNIELDEIILYLSK